MLIGLIIALAAGGVAVRGKLMGGKGKKGHAVSSKRASDTGDAESSSKSKGSADEESTPTDESADSEEPKELGEPKPTLPLDEFVINLADQDEVRYLKLNIEVEFKDAAQKEVLSKMKAQIRDTVITVASRRDMASLLSAGGKDRLKKDIKREINETLGVKVVSAVYFTAFAMQ
jgi:flagellar FliL protein